MAHLEILCSMPLLQLRGVGFPTPSHLVLDPGPVVIGSGLTPHAILKLCDTPTFFSPFSPFPPRPPHSKYPTCLTYLLVVVAVLLAGLVVLVVLVVVVMVVVVAVGVSMIWFWLLCCQEADTAVDILAAFHTFLFSLKNSVI